MFEIDLEKYYPDILFNKTIICNIRKRPIAHSPEEIIRQAFIKYLLEEKGYPLERMEIEVPLAKFSKNIKGRADLIIYDEVGRVLCFVEVKKPNEYLSEKILDQIEYYDKHLQPETVCIVIGNEIRFCRCYGDEDEMLLASVPTYQSLLSGLNNEEFLVIPPEDNSKLDFNEDDIDFFLENAIIGEDTNPIYYDFLIKLYNLYFDRETKINFENQRNIDIGIKNSKYGNASGGVFFGPYRAFFNNEANKTVSFSISSITKGEGYPIHTSLMFAVDEKGNFHHSLQLRVDKHVSIKNDVAQIYHDGSITIGKLGAGKKQELIDFISNESPQLIVENKIFLGRLIFKNEIQADSIEVRQFLENCIIYALLRDKFREMKKSKR